MTHAPEVYSDIRRQLRTIRAPGLFEYISATLCAALFALTGWGAFLLLTFALLWLPTVGWLIGIEWAIADAKRDAAT